MTGSVALDVVIGLLFIFLLYSLLATIICEIIATNMGLRARNLHEAIRRMLEDDRLMEDNRWKAFFDNIKITYQNLFRSPGRPITKEFYSQPTIKYLARSDFFSKPSYITPQNFSKTIVEIFRKYGKGKTDLEKIESILRGEIEYKSECLLGFQKFVAPYFNSDGKLDESKVSDKTADEIIVGIQNLCDAKKSDDPFFEERVKSDLRKLLKSIRKKKKSLVSDEDKIRQVKNILKRADRYLKLFEAETRTHLSSLLQDSNNDLVKFRLHLENWFDETMDRAIGWYKQKVQIVLVIVGFALAVWLNASTFEIIHTLSVDEKSRDQMVQMATSYVEHHKDFAAIDSLDAKAKLDTLEKVRKKVQHDIYAANSILGLGWDYPDKLSLYPEDTLRNTSFRKHINEYVVVSLDNEAKGVILLPGNMDKREFFKLIRTTHDGFNSIKYGVINIYKWLKDEPQIEPRILSFENGTKVYLSEWRMFVGNFVGYILTALAISLGAPFWFDMLSKLIQIRGSVQQPVHHASTSSSSGKSNASNDPANSINRKG